MNIKKKNVEQVFLSIAIIVGVVGFLFRFRYDLSGNFHPRKIQNSLEMTFPKKEIPSSFKPIFDQKFYYLNLGHHVFAFISEDQKYVLKFFRLNKFRPHFWTRFSFFQKKREQMEKEKKNRLLFLLNSHQLVDESLKKETGTYFIHLNKTKSLRQSVTLVDFWGREYKVPLDEQLFVLQKSLLFLGKGFLI